MKSLKFVAALLLICFHARAQGDNRQQRVAAYIEKYKIVAMREQKRVGIPAAVTLAQGIHETNAGASELALNANNHFGIKCKKDWKGDTYTYTDDRPDECFRKYNNDLASYKDHSDYLKSSARYATLFTLSLTDYAGWAYGLKKCGYATNPKYAQMLIKIIEDNHLQEFTYAALDKHFDPTKEAEKPVVMGSKKADEHIAEVIPEHDTPIQKETQPTPKKMIVNDGNNRYTVIRNSEKPAYGQTVMVNGLKAFYAQKGISLLNDAINYNLRYSKLLEMNDLPDAPLEADMFVYLEKKNPKGSAVYHVVKPGETMSQISQTEGIQLKNLRQFNRIKENEEPVSGSLLQLQETTNEKPEVMVKKKETQEESFAGSDTRTIPQGATRMKSGYISKQEIENTSDETKVTKSKNEEGKTTLTITKPTEVVVEDDVQNTPKDKVVTITEETTTITPDKDVIVETKTTKHVLNEMDQPVKIEKETTTVSNDDDIIVEKNTVVTPTVENENVNIADTKAVEEEKPVVKEEEPKDEFARLKARLDKAVYASETAEDKKQPKQETAKEASKEKKETTSNDKPVYYIVKKGDNAFGIAKKHNLTMAQLKALNKLDFSEIKIGQKLRVK